MFNNDELLNTNEKGVDPYDLHVSGCGKNAFKNYEYIKFIQIIIMMYTYIIILLYINGDSKNCFKLLQRLFVL